MLKLPHTLTLISLLLLFFSCSKNNEPHPSVIAQNETNLAESSVSSDENYSQNHQTANFVPNDPANKGFLVPPDLAVTQATIQVKGSSFTEVASLIELNTDKVLKSIATVQGCSATINNYQYPREDYGKRILDDSAVYFGSSELEIRISFAGLNTVADRIKQLNNCLQSLSGLNLTSSAKNASINLTLADVMPTINNLDRYRQELLAAKFNSLEAVANVAAQPSQFNANDTKCTSKGIVQIVSRSLSNIELDIDFNCQQFNKAS